MSTLYPSKGTFDEFKTPEITAWKLARSVIEHENMLVNHRLTWLYTSQAFLLSAFALLFLALTKNELDEAARIIVPWILITIGIFALYICIALQVSLLNAFRALGDITRSYNELVRANNFDSITPPLHVWKKPPLKGIVDQHFLPGAFAVVWIVILVLLKISQSPALLTWFEGFTVGHAINLLLVVFGVFGFIMSMYMLKKWKGMHPGGYFDHSASDRAEDKRTPQKSEHEESTAGQ